MALERDVRIAYDALDTSELHGATQADFLVSVVADLEIRDGARCIFEEPSFPVVELAREMLRWLSDPDRADFRFDSMSFEELGAVTVQKSGTGWVLGSVFEPHSTSTPLTWEETERTIRSLVSKVEADLRGLGLDPGKIVRQ